jgi:DeoR/GlpR family transcriptional regulator of sugar metabolism
LHKFAELTDFDTIISDAQPDEVSIAAIEKAGLRVTVAAPKENLGA